MPSMSYCVIENTLIDLHQAEEKLAYERLEDMCEDEIRAAWQLVQLCEKVARLNDWESLKARGAAILEA